MLDERLGVSYPDGQQTPDGLIRIIYDYNRVADRNILMATFREEDVAAGMPVSDCRASPPACEQSQRRSGEDSDCPPSPVNANADGKPMRKKTTGTLTIAGMPKPQPLIAGAKLFTDRDLHRCRNSLMH